MNPDPSDTLPSGTLNAPQPGATRWQPMSRPDVTSRRPVYSSQPAEQVPEPTQELLEGPKEVPPAPADQNLFYQPPEQEVIPTFTEEPSEIQPTEQAQELSLSSLETDQAEVAQIQADQDQSVIEDLELARDAYRHDKPTNHEPQKFKFVRLALYTALVLLIIIPSVYFILIKKDAPSTLDAPQRQSFVLPSDIGQKPIEESTALNIINLARQDSASEIYTNWLSDQAKTSVTQDEFTKLINSYAVSSNGETVGLVEKTVGKTSLGSESTLELNAASLIYKGEQFGQPGPIYTKINIYQDPIEATEWRLYIFEFKSTANNSEPSPLKADLDS